MHSFLLGTRCVPGVMLGSEDATGASQLSSAAVLMGMAVQWGLGTSQYTVGTGRNPTELHGGLGACEKLLSRGWDAGIWGHDAAGWAGQSQGRRISCHDKAQA